MEQPIAATFERQEDAERFARTLVETSKIEPAAIGIRRVAAQGAAHDGHHLVAAWVPTHWRDQMLERVSTLGGVPQDVPRMAVRPAPPASAPPASMPPDGDRHPRPRWAQGASGSSS